MGSSMRRYRIVVLALAVASSIGLISLVAWLTLQLSNHEERGLHPITVVTPRDGIDDQHRHIQAAINALPKARKVYATIALHGRFELRQALRLDSLTILDLRNARLELAGGADSSLIQNRAGKKGNHHIKVHGGILRGNRQQRNAEGSSCIHFDNTSYLSIEGVHVSGCALDGITVNGHGQHPQHHRLVDLIANNNYRDGLGITWAVRRAVVADISANWNNRHGVFSDHSESSYRNVRTEFNGGNGITIRNVFNNHYSGLWARKNGRHGISVKGMVESSGSDWLAANNGFIEKMAPGADLFFSADATLSYGITARSTITGVFAGASSRSTRGEAAYAIWIEPTQNTQAQYPDLLLRDVIADGPLNTPSIPGLGAKYWRTPCQSMLDEGAADQAEIASSTCVANQPIAIPLQPKRAQR